MLLGDIIALNALREPERLALVDGEREVTYAELHANATRLANALLGVAAPGDRIAMLSQNLVEYVECYYGVPAAGMALTFLNYRLHPKEWAWILNDAGAVVLIVERDFLDAGPARAGRGPQRAHRHRHRRCGGRVARARSTTRTSWGRPRRPRRR